MKKRITAIVILLVTALAAAAGVWYYHDTYLVLDGETYRRDLTNLDLSGTKLTQLESIPELQKLETLDLRGTGLTAQQYEQLQAQLPDCEILWQVPFQGAFLETDIRELTITAITDEEMQTLRYFAQLETIDAAACEDLDALLRLQEMYPDCEVRYQVSIGSQTVSNDAASLEIADADIQELMQKLPYLPLMQNVSFTGTIPENDAIYELKQAYPEIEFLWSFDLLGVGVDSNVKEIDLSGIAMESVEEVEESLKYFNCLEKVVMCDCGISSEEMDALWKRHPETRFVWSVKVGKMKLRTDITTLMPYQYGYSNGKDLYDSDCAELKYLVDMVCMDFGHQTVKDLSFVAYMPNLEYLLLCDNGIRDISPLAGAPKLKYLELLLNPLTDVSALAECPALEDVNLCSTPLTDITPLLELQNIKNLFMSTRYLTEEQIQQLEQAYPDANVMIHDGRATGHGWRNLQNYFNQRDLLGMEYMITYE